MYAQGLLPALAAIGLAAAQSSTCSTSTVTINSQADATGLSNCNTLDGTVLISPDASEPITLSGISTITGDLVCENAGQLPSLGSTDLEEIQGIFRLINLTMISNVQHSDLTKVGSIDFQALAALSQLNFPKEISEADNVLITNTFLNTLDGINLATVTDLNINNNKRLTKFNTRVRSISGSLNIESNGRNLDVEFPNLEWAANMTLRNISTIAIPSLAVVNGSMGFYENFMSEIFAPNLTTIGITESGNAGGVAFVSNSELTEISFPEFTRCGGAVQIANNSMLDTISFEKLEYVGGAIDFSGDFMTPDLPAISNVVGAFNVQSEQELDCSQFDSERGGAIQGKYVCTQTDNAQSLASGTSSGGKSTSTEDSAGGQTVMNEAVLGLSVIGSLFSLLV